MFAQMELHTRVALISQYFHQQHYVSARFWGVSLFRAPAACKTLWNLCFRLQLSCCRIQVEVHLIFLVLVPCATDNLTLCLGCIRSHVSRNWWVFFILSSAQWCSPRPAPGLHHVGWHPAFTGLPPDLHLHLLLLPWTAEWPQHDSQELVHQPLRGRAPLPHRHQPHWPAGKRQSTFCFCHGLLSQCICNVGPVRYIPALLHSVRESSQSWAPGW